MLEGRSEPVDHRNNDERWQKWIPNIKGLQQGVYNEFLSITFAPSKLYQAIYAIKQIAGGFISPMEWVELVFLGFKGTSLNFAHGYSNFLWNFGDNFLFLLFEDETTWGVFKFFGAAAMNQPWMELKPYSD